MVLIIAANLGIFGLRVQNLQQQLTVVLNGTLPGEDAQYLMAPMHRAKRSDSVVYKPSAVMLLLCEDEAGKPFIPLTKRHSYKGAHSAQVSLPGGKFEESDGSPANTAKRECFEEIGIDEIEILGPLSSLHIPISGFLVHPFVGRCLLPNPQFTLQAREVSRLIKLNPFDLLNEELRKEGYIELEGGQKIYSPWFEVENEKVWGATAMMLSEFKEILKTIY